MSPGNQSHRGGKHPKETSLLKDPTLLKEPSGAASLTSPQRPAGADVADHAPSSSCEPIGGRRLSSCFLSSRDYSFLLLPDFLCLAVSFLFLASGCSLPFVYLVPYALNPGVSSQNAALLMSTLGAVGIVGNITFGWLTDRRYTDIPDRTAVVWTTLQCRGRRR